MDRIRWSSKYELQYSNHRIQTEKFLIQKYIKRRQRASDKFPRLFISTNIDIRLSLKLWNIDKKLSENWQKLLSSLRENERQYPS